MNIGKGRPLNAMADHISAVDKITSQGKTVTVDEMSAHLGVSRSRAYDVLETAKRRGMLDSLRVGSTATIYGTHSAIESAREKAVFPPPKWKPKDGQAARTLEQRRADEEAEYDARMQPVIIWRPAAGLQMPATVAARSVFEIV